MLNPVNHSPLKDYFASGIATKIYESVLEIHRAGKLSLKKETRLSIIFNGSTITLDTYIDFYDSRKKVYELTEARFGVAEFVSRASGRPLNDGPKYVFDFSPGELVQDMIEQKVAPSFAFYPGKPTHKSAKILHRKSLVTNPSPPIALSHQLTLAQTLQVLQSRGGKALRKSPFPVNTTIPYSSGNSPNARAR